MRVHVRLSGPLHVVVGGGQIDLTLASDPATLAQALAALAARYPQADRYLRDASGGLPLGMRVLLDDTRLDGAAALATPLHDDARLTLLMPTIGG